MVKALYTAWTGLRNEERRMDVVTNNMANANTTGYKKIDVTSQSFDSQLAVKINDLTEGTDVIRGLGGVNPGVKIGETYFDMTQGNFRQTSDLYNFALSGKGFFTISTTDKSGAEHIRYTRDGDFTVTKDGFLVTKDGDFVLGSDGNRIQIPNAGTIEISVNELGEIYSGNNYVATLGIRDFENYEYLSSYGENMYEPVEGARMIEADATVTQGYLEMSNVNMVTEMVDMIAVTRAYETNQKMIQTVDKVLDKTVNNIGNV
ncbi:MAG: flagellar hook-basal body protein [Eubacteriales bacterium]|nr:flagellar hook-basal body protein [Lachnospiraceae bacterium]MDO5126657.1 flagellar hook-basal body protein [Eubacteriales bacterium]